MATKIAITSGSAFIGSPVIVSVTASAVDSGAVFHRTILEVTAALSTDSSWTVSTHSLPVSNSEVVDFDISACLRSVANKYQYAAITAGTTFPYLKYTLKAYDEYMKEGVLSENYQEVSNSSTYYALPGCFSEVERYLAGVTKEITSFSRKPTNGEVCAKGDLYVYPPAPSSSIGVLSTISAGPTSSVTTLTTAGVQTINGRTVYADSSPRNRYLFQFVNQCGVIETASAMALVKETFVTNIISENLSAPSGFKPKSGIILTKGASRKTLTMCSGPVNSDWADWWVNEFLMAKYCWILINGMWLPCAIKGDDTVEVKDETGNDFVRVDFEVSIGLTGGLRSRL